MESIFCSIPASRTTGDELPPRHGLVEGASYTGVDRRGVSLFLRPNELVARPQRTRIEKDSRAMVTISSASAESASDQ